MVKNNGQSAINQAVQAEQIATIKNDVAFIRKALEEDYVTKGEFDPIKKGFYALVTLVMITVFGAVLSQVIK